VNKILLLGVTFIALSLLLGGCTENSISNQTTDLSKFYGTWEGNMKLSMFNGRENPNNANITKLEFSENTLYMTMTNGNESQIITSTYRVDGDQLLLSFQFSDERPNWTAPFNDSFQPPFNNSEKPPFNGTQQPPFNNSEFPPFNKTQQPPFNGEMPSRESSYNFRFNENYDILYLNDYQFKKIA
jgi:hypothetical protein